MRKVFWSLFCLVFIVSLAGCDKLKFPGPLGSNKTAKAPQEAPAGAAMAVQGKVIAKVNNFPITLEDLNQEINAYNETVPSDKPEAKITNREQKIDYLKNEMIRRALLYQDALAKGLDRKEEVIKALDKTKQDLLVVELVRQEAEKVDVSSAEVEDYYNTYKGELKEPEERMIREIVVPTEQEAKDILIQVLQGADFTSLARDKSKSASAKDSGDLGFLQKGKKFPQFDAAAFSDTLEVGKISSIFKGPDGYYIIKLEARRGGKQKSLSEMWDDIKRGLTFLKQQKKIEDLVGKLSREAKIDITEGEIK